MGMVLFAVGACLLFILKVVGILLPISAFVACGFEHCVANMFFLANGFAANCLGFGASGALGLE